MELLEAKAKKSGTLRRGLRRVELLEARLRRGTLKKRLRRVELNEKKSMKAKPMEIYTKSVHGQS